MLKKLKKLAYEVARAALSNKAKVLSHQLYLNYIRKRAKILHKQQVSQWQQIRNKNTINVAFEIYHLGLWKSESLFKLMQQHPRFNPIIWVVPHYDSWDNEANARASIEYCERLGFPYVTYQNLGNFPQEEYPDILLPPEQYTFNFFRHYHRYGKPLLRHVICLTPYCFRNTTEHVDFNELLQNLALFNFCENSYIANLAAGMMDNKGCNLAVTGNPISDLFAEATAIQEKANPAWKDTGRCLKRLIWAPHWTIKKVPGFYSASTFLEVHDTMLDIARRYSDKLQIAFKPHPGLYNALCQHPEWGKERTDAYYAQWRDMDNTQLEEGQYINLFTQSDAIVHDSGSFIIEYLFTGKPCMYLQSGSPYGHFNTMNEDALKCYERGLDIECFVQRCVLGDEDHLADERVNFRKRYLSPPFGKTAAQNILDTLLYGKTQES